MGELVAAFSTDDAQKLTGLTARRLQYWDETDFIRPSVAARQGRGSPRLYSFQDMVQLKVAAQLRNRLPLQALRRLKRYLDVDAPFAVVSFMVREDGEVVYLGPDGRPESAAQPGQIPLYFEVPLRAIRADLTSSITRLRRRRGVGKVGSTRGVLGNQQVMLGTRIPAATVARFVRAGWPDELILEEYPDLRKGDIAAVRRSERARKAG